jgi:hypothetical protein
VLELVLEGDVIHDPLVEHAHDGLVTIIIHQDVSRTLGHMMMIGASQRELERCHGVVPATVVGRSSGELPGPVGMATGRSGRRPGNGVLTTHRHSPADAPGSRWLRRPPTVGKDSTGQR